MWLRELILGLEPRLTTFVAVLFAAVAVCANAETASWREAEWISAKDAPVKTGPGSRAADGTSWFATSVVNAGKVVKAEWVTTALGTYELYVNGKPVGRDFLKPGFTHVTRTRRSFSYDVTGLLDCAKGAENFFAAEVSSGWWRDKIVNFVGRKSAFRAVLVFTFADGTRSVSGTDAKTWKAGTAGPVTHAGIYDGEEHDARLLPPFRGEGLGEAEVNAEFKGVVLSSDGAEVCLRKDLAMVRGPYSLKAGERLVVDFGQNCAAIPFFRFKAAAGTVLTFLPAEMLNDADAPARGCDDRKGTVYRANQRDPKNAFRNVYTFGTSDGFVEYHPRFTFFGYRYAEISATGDVEIESIASVPVTSITKEMEVGSLTTGDKDVNRLVANVYWGLLSNYLSVPTDCPQRDERHGWTGDTQVFAETGAFFADTSSFLRKWLADLRDSQGEEGAYVSVAPRELGPRMRFGWADAGVIVPWTVWKMFGDRQALDEHWASMEKYVAYVDATRFDYDAIAELCGKVQYSDWVSLERYGDERNVFVNGWATGPKPDAKVFWNFLGACYWRYDALLMRDMAAATGRDATRYEEMAERAKRYLRERFFVAGGKFRPEVAGLQSTMLFALKLGLLEGNEKEAMKAELRANVAANHGCLKTGFLGTSILLDTLSENGMSDLAWDILLNHDFPGWLYSVDQGATTIWERWNSYTMKSGFGPASMNSFNHYAYGAVAGWIWKTVAGISADVAQPGFQRIRMAPVPDRRLGFVDASLRTPLGKVKSAWRYEGSRWIWDFTIPAGATAEVFVPGDESPKVYAAGTYRICRGGEPATDGIGRRWAQFIFDFCDDAQVVKMTNLVATAKMHGYTGVMFASGCGLGMLHAWDALRLGRLRAVKKAIDDAGLETAVGVWSFGYGKECFFPLDPNLTAAAPVFDTRYRVRNGRCLWLPRPAAELLPQPARLHSPRQVGDVGDVRRQVTPHRSYRLRVVARAEGKTPDWPISVSVLRPGAKDDCLETRVFKLTTDGSWQTNELFFASLAETVLDIRCRGYNRVYAGCAEVCSLELSETEPRIVVRRSGTPLAVRNLTTGAACREGVDYAAVPKATSVWPGPWNRAFALAPLAGGAIREGDELAVDCYAPFPTWGKWQSACMSSPEAFEIMRRSAPVIVKELNPKVWCLSYDEVRSGGGCADCRAIGDMAHVYAACVKRSMAIVRASRPDAEFYLWNDMVDPYYLKDDGRNAGLYSTMKGVWDLLPTDLGIGYWTYGCREKGVDFFVRQNRKLLICAYYDENRLERSLDWMDLARRTPGVTGIMYCTWADKWDLLGEFGERAKFLSDITANGKESK